MNHFAAVPEFSTETRILRQAGTIPFRRGPDGVEVLLITSRDTGRWVIPKGNVEPGQTAAAAAVRETYEEAGILGQVTSIPLGIYTYGKRQRSGAALAATVEVYALEIATQLKKWPERKQRRLQWMDVTAAAGLVQEQGLSVLLLRLAEIV
jgi:8-oxo-dGTP pyrophosphatase MutT (NUDIX family)